MVYAAGVDVGGFEFPFDAQDTELSNFITNTVTQVGGISNPQLMALLYDSTNGAKGFWVGGKLPDWGNVVRLSRGQPRTNVALDICQIIINPEAPGSSEPPAGHPGRSGRPVHGCTGCCTGISRAPKVLVEGVTDGLNRIRCHHPC